MAKLFFPLPLIVLVVLISCAAAKPVSSSTVDMSSQIPEGYWITQPSEGSLVVLGVSNHQRKAEDEIDSARADAAQKVAMFHGLRGSVSHVNAVGSGTLDWFSDSDVTLEFDSDYGKYIDVLNFDPHKDVLDVDGGIIIRFKYSGSLPGDLSYTNSRNRDGSPGWTTRPPAGIGGYKVGVGFARPQRWIRDTFSRSCENAAVSIISQLSSRIESSSSESSRTGVISSSYQISEGELTSFYVLEVWQDPSSNAVWTLAIAKPK